MRPKAKTNIQTSVDAQNNFEAGSNDPGFFIGSTWIENPDYKPQPGHTSFNKLAQLSPPLKNSTKKAGRGFATEQTESQECQACSGFPDIRQVPGIDISYRNRSVASIIKLCNPQKILFSTRYRNEGSKFWIKYMPGPKLHLVKRGTRDMLRDVDTEAVARAKEKDDVKKRKFEALHQADRQESTHDQLTEDQKTLLKKAKAKYFSVNILYGLIEVEQTPLHDSYVRSLDCANILQQNGNVVTTRYCKQRWCITCNRIRTAQLINGYVPELQKLDNPHFLTLTVPNVAGYHLTEMFTLMQNAWRFIYKQVKRKKKMKEHGYIPAGIKKVECTYNVEEDTFHPHYHFIVQGENFSNILMGLWMNYWASLGVKLSPKAQLTKPIESEGGYMELFKYFTKIISSNKKHSAIYVYPLDRIFQSMYRKRTFEPFGIKKVSEDIDEIQAEDFSHLKHEERMWKWMEKDWFSYDEPLTGYAPGDPLKELLQRIIL